MIQVSNFPLTRESIIDIFMWFAILEIL
jgi:hypothetical protein